MIRRLARLIAFLFVLALLLYAANIFLVQTDSIAYLTLEEIHERDDIELAIVGSSVVQLHYDPDIIEETTGLKTMSATITNLGLPGMLALTREIFETNSPEWVVLVVEGYTFQYLKEDVQTQFKLMPLLSSAQNKLDYLLNVTRHENNYAERLLMFNSFGLRSLSDVFKAIRLRLDAQAYVSTLTDEWGDPIEYTHGFVPSYAQPGVSDLTRDVIPEQSEDYAYELYGFSKELLLEIRDVCRENGANLMVVAYPAHTVHAMGERFYLRYLESAKEYLSSIGVPFYNFMYAKEELQPNLDAYYFDLHHITREGASILSASFARFFKAYTDGEDVSDWFYPGRSEYLCSIDFITNTWVTLESADEAGNLTFRAESNCGWGASPEYRFALCRADGSEIFLRDFDANDHFTCSAETLQGGTLRVYARTAGGSGETVWNEYLEDTEDTDA